MVTVTSSPSSPASYSSLPSSSTTTLPTSASCMTSDWPAQDKGCGGQSWAGKGRPASMYGSSWKRARGEVQPAVQGAGMRGGSSWWPGSQGGQEQNHSVFNIQCAACSVPCAVCSVRCVM